MIQVDRRLARERPESKLLLTVHDELVLEVPDGEVAAVRLAQAEPTEEPQSGSTADLPCQSHSMREPSRAAMEQELANFSRNDAPQPHQACGSAATVSGWTPAHPARNQSEKTITPRRIVQGTNRHPSAAARQQADLRAKKEPFRLNTSKVQIQNKPNRDTAKAQGAASVLRDIPKTGAAPTKTRNPTRTNPPIRG
ncbi:MAG: hypothetical protein IH936_12825 [Acidobacteria bacterium]|nr:hypothetical protein [Acidobacteriota bacterium]